MSMPSTDLREGKQPPLRCLTCIPYTLHVNLVAFLAPGPFLGFFYVDTYKPMYQGYLGQTRPPKIGLMSHYSGKIAKASAAPPSGQGTTCPCGTHLELPIRAAPRAAALLALGSRGLSGQGRPTRARLLQTMSAGGGGPVSRC